MKRTVQYQVISLVAISIVAWTYLFPALNWPDELYKLNQLNYDSNLYLRLLSFFEPGECTVRAGTISGSSYLSNTLHVSSTGPMGCYYTLKSINAIFLFLLVLVGFLLLRSQTERTLFILSMIWPSIVFYSTSINQQTVFSVVSIFLTTRTLESNKVWSSLLVSVVLIPLDRSFLVLSTFLFALAFMGFRPRSAVPALVFITCALFLLRPYVLDFSSTYLYLTGSSIGDIRESVSRFKDPIYVSLALLGISFVYLGGTNSLLGIGLDYLLVFAFLSFAVFKKYRNPELRVYLFSFILSYLLVVGIIPTIQTFRYYVFIMPVLLYFFVDTAERRKIYIGYSLTMSGIYLALSNVL
jgi:hypothetical protein